VQEIQPLKGLTPVPGARPVRAGDVHGLRELPPEQLQVPPLAADGAPGVVAGVTADLLTVLDLDALLSDPRLLLQEEAG
jgi:chemotaxis signal transduction protein